MHFPEQEGAGRGAEREPPLFRQAPVHRGARAQIQELLPCGGPGSLQRVSDSMAARGLAPSQANSSVGGSCHLRKKNCVVLMGSPDNLWAN